MNDSGNVTLQKDGDILSTTDSYPQWFIVVLCITIMVTFVTGVMLNLSVLIGGYSKHLKTDSGNYFIRSLSIIDLVLCFTVMPMTIAVLVKFPNLNAVICCLHEGSVSFAVTASAVCIAFVSLDRYGAIVTPTDRRIDSRNIIFIKRIICVTSGVGFLIPFFNLAFVSSIDMITDVKAGMNCRRLLFAVSPTFLYEIYYLTFFALAVITVLVSYLKIIRVAKNKIKNIPRANRTKGVISKQDMKIQERKMISLTAAIVCSFVICWGSYVVVSMFSLIISACMSFDMVKLFLLVFAMTTTSIHPLVYTFIHRDLRHAYIKKIMMESTNRTRLYSSKIGPTTFVQDMIIKSASQGLSVGMNTSVDMEILSTGQRKTSSDVSLTSPEKKWRFHHTDPQTNSTEGNIVTVASYDTNFNQEQPSTSGLQNTKWPTSKSGKCKMISRYISSMDNDNDEDFEINPLPEVVVSARNLTDHTAINKYRHVQDVHRDSCITSDKPLPKRIDLDNTKESLL